MTAFPLFLPLSSRVFFWGEMLAQGLWNLYSIVHFQSDYCVYMQRKMCFHLHHQGILIRLAVIVHLEMKKGHNSFLIVVTTVKNLKLDPISWLRCRHITTVLPGCFSLSQCGLHNLTQLTTSFWSHEVIENLAIEHTFRVKFSTNDRNEDLK